MGWGNCGTDSKGRGIGYSFDSTCDHQGCAATIHRGLAFACGGMHGDGTPNWSCERYFCGEHRELVEIQEGPDCEVEVLSLCAACVAEARAAGVLLNDRDDAQGAADDGAAAIPPAYPTAADGLPFRDW